MNATLRRAKGNARLPGSIIEGKVARAVKMIEDAATVRMSAKVYVTPECGVTRRPANHGLAEWIEKAATRSRPDNQNP